MGEQMADLAGAGDWIGLQNKIFTRWVAQKLRARFIECKDVVAEMGDGILLVQLIEILSEQKFSGKMDPPKMEVQKLDNLTRALKFVFDQGVQAKLKPDPNDVMKGEPKVCLGLIWAIMLKFMKFGDEEDQVSNAKDALMLWVQNKTAGYAGVKIENMNKSFHDGLALCAIVHKHRPRAFDFASLDPANAISNIQLALDQAQLLFRMEKYVTPEEVLKLDENSMTVFVGDFYQSIAEARKLDIAGRRISKVIKLTEDNDARRAAYVAKAKEWNATKDSTLAWLNDRTIDNTMEGARKRLAEFDDYKQNKKSNIMLGQLELEGMFGDLALILRFNNRPAYVPPEGLALADIANGVTALEKSEQDRKTFLYAELDRQFKIVKLNSQHQSRFDKIKAFTDEKTAYLSATEDTSSVKLAEQALENFADYEVESKNIQEGLVVQMKGIGAKLAEEKYENQSSVQKRESDTDAAFSNMASLASAKKAKLEGDLKREHDKVDEICKRFAGLVEPHSAWVHGKAGEITNSTAELEAQKAFIDGLLGSYDSDGAKLEQMKAIAEEMDKMEIHVNPHTLLSYIDLAAQWSQFKTFLLKKQAAVAEEIARKASQGITPEQFAEISAMFKQFDKNSNGQIDRKELKAALYSLGLEKTKAEVEEILKTHGDGANVKPEGFKNFMITVLAVSDTKEDILASFVTINQEKGEDVASPEKLAIILEPHDQEYLKKTAPPVDAGLDFKTWTADVFSR